jgi:hypothetical protein
MDDHLLAYKQILEKKPHSDKPYERASIIFENIVVLYSVSRNANSMVSLRFVTVASILHCNATAKLQFQCRLNVSAVWRLFTNCILKSTAFKLHRNCNLEVVLQSVCLELTLLLLLHSNNVCI